MEPQNGKPRLRWIDTAKGICILLVILYHTTEHIMDLSPALRDMLRATRMPLYYTIAGLFVSVKHPGLFINKKVNRLLVPFCFFMLLGNAAAYLKSMAEGTDFAYYSPLYYILTEDIDGHFFNSPIWFLFSLFDMYLFFMVIDRVARRCGAYQIPVKIGLGLLAGFCGIRCNRMGIDLPLFIDSTLTATPFFIFGHLIMHETAILKNDTNRYASLAASLAFIGMALLIANGNIDYRINNIRASVFHTYVPGFLGVTGLLLLSKTIGSVPVVTLIGRYSIVYLGTHYLFFRDLRVFFETHLGPHQLLLVDWSIFVSTVLLCMASCWVLLRTVPFLIAQKDILFIGDINRLNPGSR